MTNQPAKPIVPGCLAVIINAPLIPEIWWRIVKVIDRCQDEPFLGEWLLDIPEMKHEVTAPDKDLMRIDDPDIQSQIEEEKVLTAMPWTEKES